MRVGGGSILEDDEVSIATNLSMEMFLETQGLPTIIEPMVDGLFRVTVERDGSDLCPFCTGPSPGYGRARIEAFYNGHLRTFHQECFDKMERLKERRKARERHMIIARRARRWARVVRCVKWVIGW